MKPIVDHPSIEELQALLKDCNLPYKDLTFTNSVFFGYYSDTGDLIGAGGLEFYGNSALLRSLAVAASHRNESLGRRIVSDLIQLARERSTTNIFLLTEAAHRYFLKFGFDKIDRENIPLEIRRSSQFSTVCPVSAACMVLAL